MDPHVIANIAQLQDREKQLHNDYSSLDTPELKQQSLDNMRKLTQSRIELFNSLKTQYAKDATESNDVLKDNMATLNIVETELNAAKGRLEKMNKMYVNKMRQVEISTYSSQKYMAYNKFLGLLIKWCVIIAIILYIAKKSPIPEAYLSRDNSNTTFLFILTVVGFFGLYQILNHFYDLTSRNNMNFNEYDFNDGFSEKTVVKHVPSTPSMSTPEFEKMAKSLHLGCVDNECCAHGTMYDALKKQCMPIIKTHNENTKAAALTKGVMGTPDNQSTLSVTHNNIEGGNQINDNRFADF